MVQAYCMKCKKKIEAIALEFSKTNSKNGMHCYKGKCPECGCGVGVLSKEKLE